MSSRNTLDEPEVETTEPRFDSRNETPIVVRTNGMRRVLIAAAVGLVLLVAIYMLFIRSSKPEGATTTATVESSTPAAPVPISTATAVVRELPAYIEASGSLEPFELTDVAPIAGGKVVSVSVNEGDFVGRGQTIARLDDRDARIRIEQAEAALTQARANVQQARANLGLGRGDRFDPTEVAEVRSAKASLDLAVANERRYRSLVETGDIPQAQYDEVKARADTARQAYEAAIAKAKAGSAGVDVAVSGVEAAQANLAAARKALADTVISAPLAGYVSKRPVAVGEYVTTSTPVATLVQNSTLKLMLQVAEADAARISVGQTVALRVDAYPGREFGGTITAIIPALDPSSRALVAVVQVRNPDNALKPGMFGTARVVDASEMRRGVLVPREAVVPATGDASRVFVVANNRAEARVVETGREVDGMIEIASGVQEGEQVATAGIAALTDGAPVVVNGQ
jgi:multidrug efflux pump subunit AcrA (membrane-fusion protein)